jgi:hypothetical protein
MFLFVQIGFVFEPPISYFASKLRESPVSAQRRSGPAYFCSALIANSS